jgi:hypothetical protein
MAIHAVKFIFLVFALFFFALLIHIETERSAVGLSVWKVENTPIFYNSEVLHIVRIVWNTSG